MSDYKESNVSGTQWKRACRVVVENPLNGVPSLIIVEEDAMLLGDKTITNPCANLSCSFDAANPLHMDIYAKLNEVYVLLREARDAVAVAPVEVLP